VPYTPQPTASAWSALATKATSRSRTGAYCRAHRRVRCRGLLWSDGAARCGRWVSRRARGSH